MFPLPTSPSPCAWIDSAALACTVRGLSAGVLYSFSVRLVTDNGFTSTVYSPAVIYVPKLSTLATIIAASVVSPSSVLVFVNATDLAPAWATMATVEFFDAASNQTLDTVAPCPWSSLTASSDNNIVNCTLINLQPATAYAVQARVVGDAALGPWSTPGTGERTTFFDICLGHSSCHFCCPVAVIHTPIVQTVTLQANPVGTPTISRCFFLFVGVFAFVFLC